MTPGLKRFLTGTAAGRWCLMPLRLVVGWRTCRPLRPWGVLLRWWVGSRELGNWSYLTTADNQRVLCALVASLTGTPVAQVRRHAEELFADDELIGHLAAARQRNGLRWHTDAAFKPGKRLAYYLLVRAMKPRRVVEAGLDKGFGAQLIARALQRNAQEGVDGEYVGLEYDPDKPVPFFDRPFHDRCTVVRCDSVRHLQDDPAEIDLFIHDTTADEPHMTRQLGAALERLSRNGIIVSVWTNPSVFAFAEARAVHLVTHKDETVDHPHGGSRLAFLQRPRDR